MEFALAHHRQRTRLSTVDFGGDRDASTGVRALQRQAGDLDVAFLAQGSPDAFGLLGYRLDSLVLEDNLIVFEPLVGGFRVVGLRLGPFPVLGGVGEGSQPCSDSPPSLIEALETLLSAVLQKCKCLPNGFGSSGEVLR